MRKLHFTVIKEHFFLKFFSNQSFSHEDEVSLLGRSMPRSGLSSRNAKEKKADLDSTKQGIDPP
jgi:hypothetical protein